ncbi:hypothetical protein MRX96_035729 [Rhipicephalus microplus]
MVASSWAPVFLDPWLKILARCCHPMIRVGQCTPPFAMHSLIPAEDSHRGNETHVSSMHAPKPRPRRDDRVPWTGWRGTVRVECRTGRRDEPRAAYVIALPVRGPTRKNNNQRNEKGQPACCRPQRSYASSAAASRQPPNGTAEREKDRLAASPVSRYALIGYEANLTSGRHVTQTPPLKR